jgi:hypothetical protein
MSMEIAFVVHEFLMENFFHGGRWMEDDGSK